MATLAELRAQLQEQEAAKQGKSNSRGDGLTYPFWNGETGSTATLRFLPDGNNDNTYFWRERQVIKLEFPGIKGYDEAKPITIQVPCMEMWQETCPILQEIRPWFKGNEEQEALARKYWKKRTYMFQGFVRTSSIDEGDDTPENPIRKFIIGPQIFEPIKNSLLDPEFESMPTDYVNGTDFSLKKGQKGRFADWSSSVWSRKESSLTEEEASAIDKYGLADLGDYLPAKPDAEQLNALFEMFEASVAGELYDPDQWAEYYKPYGFNSTSDSRKDNGSAKASTPASTPAASTDTSTTETTADAGTADTGTVTEDASAQDAAPAGNQPAVDSILAKIRQNG